MRYYKLSIVIMFSFFIAGFWFGKPPLQAIVDKTAVRTGEVFTYTIVVEGTFKKPMLMLPDFSNLRIISQNQSRRYVLRKKKKTLKTTIVFSLFSDHPGLVRLGPALLQDNRRKYKSKGFIIKVFGDPLPQKKKLIPYIQEGTTL